MSTSCVIQNMQFILPFPPSVNAQYNISRGKRVKGKKVEAWIEKATKALNMQNAQPIDYRCSLIYELNHPDNRNRDDSNYAKFVTDLLVSQDILTDDSRRYVKSTTTIWTDKKDDFITVHIVNCDDFDSLLTGFFHQANA